MEPRTDGKRQWGPCLSPQPAPPSYLTPSRRAPAPGNGRTSGRAHRGRDPGVGAALPQPSPSPCGGARTLQRCVLCPRGSPQPAGGRPVPRTTSVSPDMRLLGAGPPARALGRARCSHLGHFPPVVVPPLAPVTCGRCSSYCRFKERDLAGPWGAGHAASTRPGAGPVPVPTRRPHRPAPPPAWPFATAAQARACSRELTQPCVPARPSLARGAGVWPAAAQMQG